MIIVTISYIKNERQKTNKLKKNNGIKQIFLLRCIFIYKDNKTNV